MLKLRFRVVESAFGKKVTGLATPAERPSKYHGKLVLSRKKMFKYLSKRTYERLVDSIDNDTPLDRETANIVASGMKKWATGKGVTHYTHWFHPLTEGTAEKHDTFIKHDDKGGVFEGFKGKLLTQQGPDASSFPNGGICDAFEARGHLAWDPSSPAFIVGDTLCIPTIFITCTGESLDCKAPLLKALETMNEAAADVCHHLSPDVKKVYAYLSWEQEYFLIGEGLYATCPDLLMTGRISMGRESSKDQQLEGHYSGVIPIRVVEFMKDLEVKVLRLGIPVETHYDRVAPNQFELAPIFEGCNLANNYSLLIMALIYKISHKHGFRVLLHERPFRGVNGSDKYNSQSLGTDTGVLLVGPSKTPEGSLHFMTFAINVLEAVYTYNALLRTSISSTTNAHRPGMNEAPPAIIPSLLRIQLSKVLEHLENSDTEDFGLAGKQGMRLDTARILELLVDNMDRNRTSPFAFTGNRLEFRVISFSANCAAAVLVLNATMTDQLRQFKAEVDAKIATGEDKFATIIGVTRRDIKECKTIHFDGNGYSEEWKVGTIRRGLDCETSVPLIFDAYSKDSSAHMFESTGVMTRKELETRNGVKWEMHTKKVQIEVRVLSDLAVSHIVPIVTKYRFSLIDNVHKVHELFPTDKAAHLSSKNMGIIEDMTNRTIFIEEEVDKMVNVRKIANKIESEREKAIVYHDRIVPMMKVVRYHIDKLELVIDDQIWALPKYRELLFIR